MLHIKRVGLSAANRLTLQHLVNRNLLFIRLIQLFKQHTLLQERVKENPQSLRCLTMHALFKVTLSLVDTPVLAHP